MNNEPEHDEDDLTISRTARKKSMQIYIKIGEELLTLSRSQLSTIPVDNELSEALKVAKKIKVGNALKRQMSFIGKLIRTNNYIEIQAALDELKLQDARHESISKKAEKWREKILAEEPKALAEFIGAHDNCDKQKLNQLVRSAIKEVKQELKSNDTDSGASKHKKALFKLLRITISEQTSLRG
ncbi:MAG: ribosome-associated protein [Kiritimatiellia bacterium]|jgi:ribosome-associated protein